MGSSSAVESTAVNRVVGGSNPSSPANPLVTVIVPHHLNENDEYARWCVKSVLASEGVDLEVLFISDAQNPFTPANDSRLRVDWRTDLNNVTKKWKHGLSIANPASKYVMLISDDVMVSKYTIDSMARVIGQNQMILSPASNCDSTTRFYTQFYIAKLPVGVKCHLEYIKGFEQHVIDYPKSQPILIDPGWVSFYCTMFPKTVLERVGDFDESLDCRHNDVDYCQRARQLGIPSFIHLGVFALHFGDRTLPQCTNTEEYQKADEAYRQKYKHLLG